MLGFNFVREALGHRHGTGRAVQSIVVLVAIALVFLLARWAIGAEHRLRGGATPGAGGMAPAGGTDAFGAPAAFGATAAVAPWRGARSRRLTRRRVRYGPISLGIALLLWGGLSIGMTVGAIINISNAQRSSFTQAHGVRVAGTVVSADNTSVCSARSGCSYTASIIVRLSSPVRGITTTTVSYPSRTTLAPGDSVTVLVDPQQLGYAELPGHPNTTATQWALGFGLAVVFALLAVWDVRSFRRLLAARRRLRAQGGAATVATVRGSS